MKNVSGSDYLKGFVVIHVGKAQVKGRVVK